jgi:hypothetical protein
MTVRANIQTAGSGGRGAAKKPRARAGGTAVAAPAENPAPGVGMRGGASGPPAPKRGGAGAK